MLEASGIGKGTTVNVCELVAEPSGVVTETAPVVPFPVRAVICVAVFEIIDVTGVPPIVTDVAPDNTNPLIVISDPSHPEVGVKSVIKGVVGGQEAVKVYAPYPPATELDTRILYFTPAVAEKVTEDAFEQLSSLPATHDNAEQVPENTLR